MLKLRYLSSLNQYGQGMGSGTGPAMLMENKLDIHQDIVGL